METIKIEDREQEVLFTNWTSEDFLGKWDFAKNKKIWELKAGRSYYLPFYLAEHFASGIADRELIKEKLPTNDPKKQEFLNKCVDIFRQEEQAEYVKPTYVKMKEVALKRDRRNKDIQEETGVKTQINEKALEEEFE